MDVKNICKSFNTSEYKWWREDKKMYEEKKVVMWFVTYYVYSIFNGKLVKKIRLFKYKNPEYLKKPILTSICIGRKEFQEDYSGNRYLVPTNYEVDLTKP